MYVYKWTEKGLEDPYKNVTVADFMGGGRDGRKGRVQGACAGGFLLAMNTPQVSESQGRIGNSIWDF